MSLIEISKKERASSVPGRKNIEICRLEIHGPRCVIGVDQAAHVYVGDSEICDVIMIKLYCDNAVFISE